MFPAAVERRREPLFDLAHEICFVRKRENSLLSFPLADRDRRREDQGHAGVARRRRRERRLDGDEAVLPQRDRGPAEAQPDVTSDCHVARPQPCACDCGMNPNPCMLLKYAVGQRSPIELTAAYDGS